MSPTKPVGEKPPNPNGSVGNTGAQVVSPAPNQDVRGPGRPPGDDGAPAANTAAAGLEKPKEQCQQLLLMQQDLETMEQRQQLLLMRTC